eukprot:NODE_95_length_21511_cov_0.501168.p9 type:complete len:212 gc:universal NODE_95_length_21511_cov_0.501168:5348-4713(-)
MKNRLMDKMRISQDKIEKMRNKKSKKSKPKITNTLVIDCIEYLDSYGLQEQGLYRVPGALTEVQKLQQLYLEGPVNLFEIKPTINSIATLLKQNFRDNDPILPSGEIEKTVLQSTLNQLPKEQFTTLSILCAHLARVCYFEEVNKMSLSNICVVWCPSLKVSNTVLESLINDGDELFKWSELHDNPFADEEFLENESSEQSEVSVSKVNQE